MLRNDNDWSGNFPSKGDLGVKTQIGDLDSVLRLSTSCWLTSQIMPALEVVRKIIHILI